MGERKKCEVCSAEARTYCESDGASLCWDCDGRVHSANFLVAKHRRSLLCRLCLSPTPWSSSGPILTPSVSLCVPCSLLNYNPCHPNHSLVEHEHESSSSSSEEEDLSSDDEIQVVPWSKPSPSVSSKLVN